MGVVGYTSGGWPIYSGPFRDSRPRSKPAKCPVCGKKCKSAEGVLMHIEAKHQNWKPVSSSGQDDG